MCDSRLQLAIGQVILHCELAHSREDLELLYGPEDYLHEAAVEVTHGFPPHHKQYAVVRWTEELPYDG